MDMRASKKGGILMKKCLWLASTALLLVGQTAWAQTQPAQQENGVEELIVTAERREVNVQQASVAIEVISGDELNVLNDVSDLTSLSPGVQVGNSGPNPQVYIRGVGDPATNGRSQTAVAFSIDGVYYARGTQVGPAMFDVSRVEVLKGPQGTLYGRNASGGAVNVITNNPRLGELGGFVSAEGGSYSLGQGSGAVNVPLGETAALRIAGQVIDRDGYTSNGGQDQDIKAARVKFLWEPSETVSLLVAGDLAKIGGEGSGVVFKDNPGDPWRDITDPPLPYPFLFGPNTAPFTAPTDRFIDSDIKGMNAELNIDVGFATLTFIPAFRSQDQQSVSYTSNFRFWEGASVDQTTFEGRLGNDEGSLKWTVGAYYFKEEQDIFLAPFSSGRLAAVTFDQATKAKAVFGQGTFSVADNFRLIGGVRWTEEEIGGEYQQGVGGPPLVPFTSTTPVIAVGPITAEKTNFKVGAEFDLAEQSMLFATYATGFKGGGFSQTLACGADPFNPEEVKALTLGSRNRFFDNRLQVNVEAFHWRYESQQISYVGLDNCGGTTLLTRNPGNATIQGFNLDVVMRPWEGGNLRLAAEYNDATYDSFKLQQLGLGAYTPSGGTLCSSSPLTGGRFEIDCAGQRLPRTPEWTGVADYEHRFTLASEAEVRAGIDVQYAFGTRYLDFNFLPNGQDDDYTIFNAQLTYIEPEGRWSLTAYANNIGDEVVYTSASSVPQLDAKGHRLYSANIMPPRTYGVRARFDF